MLTQNPKTDNEAQEAMAARDQLGSGHSSFFPDVAAERGQVS